MPEQTFGQQLGMQTATQAANNIMGIIMGGFNDQRQLEQQGKLNEQSKGMIDYNYMKQLQMWKDTNYSAQIEQLKKAGLNPGLIYGMSGGGGTTAGTGSATTAPHAPQGGGELIAAQGMGIQYQLLQAQKENIEADTANKKADLPVKGATVPKIEAETKSISQGIENAKAQQALQETELELKQIESHVKGKSQNMAIAMIQTQLREEVAKMEMLERDNSINAATKQTKIQTIRAELANILARTALTKAQEELSKQGIKVNDEQMNKWKAEIANLTTIANQRDQEIAIQKFKAEVEANNPGVWQVLGGWAKQASGKLGELFGDSDNTQTVPEPKKK